MKLQMDYSKGLSVLMVACVLLSTSIFYSAFAADEDVELSLTVNGAVQAFFADQTLTPIGSHSVTMSQVDFNAADVETSTGTLTGAAGGTIIAIVNPTSTPAWDVGFAPAAGATALWASGSLEMDFNDADTPDDNGTDPDTASGKLSLNFASATAAVCPTVTGPTDDGITLGTNSVFEEGVVDSITIATADGTASAPGCIAVDQIAMSQVVPPGTPASSTPFTMVFTLTTI